MTRDKLEVAEDDLELVDSQVRFKGVAQRAIPLGELASEANLLRGAEKPGTKAGLEATNHFQPKSSGKASGAHAMILEIDKETMDVMIQKFVVGHDAGRVINPLIVDGQFHGGVVQGIGHALSERVVCDDHGQLLSGTFMDYLLPTSLDVPGLDIRE